MSGYLLVTYCSYAFGRILEEQVVVYHILQELKELVDDGPVVEGELWQVVNVKPPCLCGIVAALDLGEGLKGEVHYGDDALSWVAVYGTVAAELEHLAQRHARLFHHLAPGAGLQVFVYLHKAAGKRPAVLIGFVAPLDEQHA